MAEFDVGAGGTIEEFHSMAADAFVALNQEFLDAQFGDRSGESSSEADVSPEVIGSGASARGRPDSEALPGNEDGGGI